MGETYAYAVARIRVKEKNLLSDSDTALMANASSAGEVIDFLKSKGWGDGKEFESADSLLDYESGKISALMRELKISPEIFEILEIPKQFHNIKAGIKEICTSETNENIFYDLPGFGRGEVLKILKEKNFNLLPPGAENAAEKAYKVMVETRDGQMCDAIIDRACLEKMKSEAENSGEKVIRDYVGAVINTADIKISVRGTRMKKDLNFFSQSLAPSNDFDVFELARRAALGEKELFEFLKANGFSKLAEAIEKSPSEFEKECDNQLMDSIKSQKTVPLTAGPVIAYYLARQNEIKTARIIISAKQNGFSSAQILKRVRKMYV